MDLFVGRFGISWPTGSSNVKQFIDGKDMAGLYGMPQVKQFDKQALQKIIDLTLKIIDLTVDSQWIHTII